MSNDHASWQVAVPMGARRMSSALCKSIDPQERQNVILQDRIEDVTPNNLSQVQDNLQASHISRQRLRAHVQAALGAVARALPEGTCEVSSGRQPWKTPLLFGMSIVQIHMQPGIQKR